MRALAICLTLLAACSEDATNPDATPDAGVPTDASDSDSGRAPTDASLEDPGSEDAHSADALTEPPDGGATQEDATAGDLDAQAPPIDAGPTPTSPLMPAAGELTIYQLDLPTGVTLRLGEAAIIVGPAGSIALLDVGNTNHDDEVRARVAEINQGLGRPLNQVEWVVLTHFHGDHVGAFADLFSGASPLTVTRGVVYRGFVDLGDGMNVNDYAEICNLLIGPLAAQAKPLCTSAVTPACTWTSGDDPAAASNCAGLRQGDLVTPDDDELGLPASFALDGVRVSISAANAWVHDGTQFQSMSFGRGDNNEENGRSLVGEISYGAFRYHFGGDLTGSGDPGEPDVESFWATHAGHSLYGALGADVIHAHHHARRTSSNANLVELLAPSDGRSRNVIAGINSMYVGSPAPEIVSAWTQNGRLGGGAFWVTEIATGGADPTAFPGLVAAEGEVIVQTSGGGAGYWVQATGPSLITRGFISLR